MSKNRELNNKYVILKMFLQNIPFCVQTFNLVIAEHEKT